MLVALGACATHERPKTVSEYCLNARPISYAELPAGQVDDPGNNADTLETVKQIEPHNARYDALCAKDD